MSDTTEPMAYIARKACGCFVFAGVDVPADRAGNAKEIAWAMKKGYPVDRVTCQYVRDNWRSTCEVCEPVETAAKTRRAKKIAAGQMELL